MVMSVDSCPSLSQTFDPFDRQLVDDPFPIWALAQQTEPIFYSQVIKAWVVTGHRFLEEIFRDAKRFPSSGLSMMNPPPEEAAAILATIPIVPPLRALDPPSHPRQRRPTLAAVSPRRVAALEAPIREIANSLVDRFESDGSCDFYDAFAFPFPLKVISNLLGFDDDVAQHLHYWSSCRVALAWGRMEHDEWVRAAHGFVEFHEFIQREVLDRRDHPVDDGLTDFVHAGLTAAAPMTLPELYEQTIALITGGHETTANWLTLSMYHMLSKPERWQAVCESTYPIAEVVEESLRYDSAVRAVWRKAAHDTIIGGVELRSGDRLYCVNGAANRDGSVFDEPDEFQPGRDQARLHFTFGRASHHCVGASLARLEGEVAFDVLRRRLPGIRLTTGELHCQDNATLRITKGLDVAWD